MTNKLQTLGCFFRNHVKPLSGFTARRQHSGRCLQSHPNCPVLLNVHSTFPPSQLPPPASIERMLYPFFSIEHPAEVVRTTFCALVLQHHKRFPFTKTSEENQLLTLATDIKFSARTVLAHLSAAKCCHSRIIRALKSSEAASTSDSFPVSSVWP